MIRRLGMLVVMLVVCVALFGAAQTQDQAKTKENIKARIDGAILKVIQSAVLRQSSSIQTARALGVPFDGSTVTVNVVLNARAAFGANAVTLNNAVSQAFGRTNVISAQSKSFLRLKVPVTLLPLIEQLFQLIPNIAYIRPPLVPQTLAVSEGVGLIGADQLHNNGNFGQGTKIAVIDLGFAGLSTAKARGELPNNIITRDFTGTGLEFGTTHGTAVAEIVHDVAPNAQLYVMKIGDEIDLENAVSEAISQGIQIINHSVGWFNTSYYDGTGTIANIIQPALSAGILWVNSAGNYAQRHFKGLFRDNNGNGWTEFSGNDESIDIRANAGETIQLYLTWRDWPLTAQDYDLVLLNAQGSQVAISDKTQNGGQEPTESLRYFVPVSGTYRVQVQAFNTNTIKELTLFSLFHDIEHTVVQSSLVTPADVNGVLSVAAIRKENWNTGPQAPYSSQGPTNDGRSKPDITGPDNVLTTSQGAFEGTSAAAPHVAGAAALLLSQNPGMGASQLRSQLRASASAVGSPLATGSGRVQLTAPAVQRPDLTIINTDFSPRTPNIGDLLRYEISVRNQGNANASSFTVRIEDRNGSEQRTVSGLAAGASTVVTFSRSLTVSSDTVTVTVDASNQVTESDENNNSTQFQVSGQTPPPANFPDLIVETFDVSPSSPTVGSNVQLVVVVRNQGNATAGPFRVEIQGAGNTLRQDVGGLGVGAGVRLTGNTTLASGGQTFTVLVDSLNQVQESNENNNSRAITIQGNTPPPVQAPQGTIRTDKTTYQIGDSLTLVFSTDRQAYAYIFNVTQNGEVSQVFPSSLSPNNFVGPGSHTLPDGGYRFTVTGPTGTESLHLLLSLRPVNLGLNGLRNVQFTNASVFSNELNSRAQSQLSNGEWSTQFTTFQIGTIAPPTNQPPRATFTFSPTSPLPGQVVSFDASSSFDPDGQINQYRWDFDGNGVTDAFGSRVNTTFPSSRAFTVTLTVLDNLGLTASTSQSVQVRSQQVNQPPIAQFSFNPNRPSTGEVVVFDATASFDPDGVVVDYRWDLNSDGRIDVVGSRVSARFNTARDYLATLTVTDNQGASSSISQTVSVGQIPVNQPPIASFTFSPTSPLIGQTINFNASASRDPDGNIVDYRWDFNSDGNVDAIGVNVSTQFNTAGTFQVRLTVRDNSGLTHTTQQSVSVQSNTPPPPSADPIPPGMAGIFILGETEKLHLVIQGDANWTSPHAFQIKLTTNTLLTNLHQEVQGNANGNLQALSGSDVVIVGEVANGRIDFFFDQKGPPGHLQFATSFAGGVFIIQDAQRFSIGKNSFMLVARPAGDIEIFPFAGKTLYTCSTRFNTRRERFDGCERIG